MTMPSNTNETTVQSLERSFKDSATLLEPQSAEALLKAIDLSGSNTDIVDIAHTIVDRIAKASYEARLYSASQEVALGVEECLLRTWTQLGHCHEGDERVLVGEVSLKGEVFSSAWRDMDDLIYEEECPNEFKPAEGDAQNLISLQRAVASANRSKVFNNLRIELSLSKDLMLSVRTRKLDSMKSITTNQ